MFFQCITSDMAAILKNTFFQTLPKQTYLAGGTAVALHLGHRLSVDLDFFTPSEMDSLEWYNRLKTAFSGEFELSAIKLEKNTLVVHLNRTGFSLFVYPYRLIETPVIDKAFPTPIASLRDLALMKLIAINQRGASKDFIDLKWILEYSGFSLQSLFRDIARKYAVGEEMAFQIKKSLVYFEDAERDLNLNMYDSESGRFKRLDEHTWCATKRYFEERILSDSGN